MFVVPSPLMLSPVISLFKLHVAVVSTSKTVSSIGEISQLLSAVTVVEVLLSIRLISIRVKILYQTIPGAQRFVPQALLLSVIVLSPQESVAPTVYPLNPPNFTCLPPPNT